MSNIENPPAFPRTAYDGRGDTGSPFPHHEQDGMTLRDYLAAKALQGFLASDVLMKELDDASKKLRMSGKEEAEVQPKVIASKCFLLADAMLKARMEQK